MLQRHITFEWYAGEADFERWGGLTLHVLHREREHLILTKGERTLVFRLLRTLAMLLVIVVAASGASTSYKELNRTYAYQGIEFAVALEDQAWRTRDRLLFDSLADADVSSYWIREWRDYWRFNGLLMPDLNIEITHVQTINGVYQADVNYELPAVEWWQPSGVYRETRFYSQVGGRWLRTLPPQEYWGSRKVYDSEHLRFIYYEREAEAVEAAANVLEPAYVELYSILETEPPALEDKIVIGVLPERVERWSWSENRLDLTSPALLRVPDQMSDADYLVDRVLRSLTYRAVRDAAPGTATRYLYRWPVMVYGVRNWLQADLAENPSQWHVQAEEIFRTYTESRMPMSLSTISNLHGQQRPEREQVVWRFMAAESIVDYVLATHGRDHLSHLLFGLVRNDNWRELISELYGVSVSEFEEGWNRHLRERYRIGVEQSPERSYKEDETTAP